MKWIYRTWKTCVLESHRRKLFAQSGGEREAMGGDRFGSLWLMEAVLGQEELRGLGS